MIQGIWTREGMPTKDRGVKSEGGQKQGTEEQERWNRMVSHEDVLSEISRPPNECIPT